MRFYSLLANISIVFLLGCTPKEAEDIQPHTAALPALHKAANLQHAFALSDSLELPVLLYFTASANTTSQAIELALFEDSAVHIELSNYVLAVLDCDAVAPLAEEVQGVFPLVRPDGSVMHKKVRTVGEQYTMLRTAVFNTQEAPFYVAVSVNGCQLGASLGFTRSSTDMETFLKTSKNQNACLQDLPGLFPWWNGSALLPAEFIGSDATITKAVRFDPHASSLGGGKLGVLQWNGSLEHIKNNRYKATISGTLAPGWMVYSGKNDPNDGPIGFHFLPGEDNILIGEVQEFGVLKVEDKTVTNGVFLWSNRVELVQYLEFEPSITKPELEFEYITCDANRCLPPEVVTITFDVNAKY